jgi:hypothetical protein
MKTESLRVGVKGDRPAVKVPVRIAETLEDVQVLTKGQLPVFLRMFNRGFRIESQERSGAREAFREGQPEENIAKLVADYDATVVRPRVAGPRKPVEVKLQKGKRSYSPDELAALLQAAGIKANLVTAE